VLKEGTDSNIMTSPNIASFHSWSAEIPSVLPSLSVISLYSYQASLRSLHVRVRLIQTPVFARSEVKRGLTLPISRQDDDRSISGSGRTYLILWCAICSADKSPHYASSRIHPKENGICLRKSPLSLFSHLYVVSLSEFKGRW
jgi:hypothetical protein